METLNSAFATWEKTDSALLGSLFPSGYESPLSENIFSPPQIYTPDETPPDDKVTYWVIYVGFDSQQKLEDTYVGRKNLVLNLDEGKNKIDQPAEDFLRANPTYMLCFYLKSPSSASTKSVLLRMGVQPFASYSNAADYANTADVIAKRLVELGSKYDGFAYDLNDLTEAFKNAVPSTKNFPDRNSKEDKSKLYYENYDHLLARADNKNDPEMQNAIRMLCETLTKINYDVVQSYNQQTDIRYNTKYNNRKLTVADILSMNRRLLKLSKEIKKLQNAEFANADQVIDFVNNNLKDNSAVGAETMDIISYPFSQLSYQKRKALLLLFLTDEIFEFSEEIEAVSGGGNAFDMGGISYGDLIMTLLISASLQDRIRMLNDWEVKPRIFKMIETVSYGSFLQNIFLIMGSAAIQQIDTEEKQAMAVIDSMITGKYMFYDDAEGKIHSASIDEKLHKIKLTNEGHATGDFELMPSPIMMDDMESEEDIAIEQEYLDKYASGEIYFDPLDMLVFTAEGTIKSDVLKALYGKDFVMNKDDILLLPACIIYLVIREFEDKKSAFALLLIITLIFLPFGIAALAAAIEAGSVLGIIAATGDIAMDVTVVAVNSPQAIEDNPERAKFINTLAFFYAMGRLGYSLRNLPSFGKANKNFFDAVKLSETKLKNLFQRLIALFKTGTKSDELFREIFKVINKGKLTEYQFAKLAKKIEQEFGIKMHLIDGKNLAFRDLYKLWEEEKSIYAVFHSHTFKNGRYNVVLEGPAIYFFQDAAFKVGSYTVQHELFHVKLWYKLTQELGKKGGLAAYRAIPRWLHEADVLGEMLRANKLKPGKWGMEDILGDLNVLNKNLRLNEAWQKSIQKAMGKIQLELKDLENWDITKWINK